MPAFVLPRVARPTCARACARGRGRRVAATPPVCENSAEASRILPSYFEAYTETVCEYEQDKKDCMENITAPDVKRQEEIVEMYKTILSTYPLENAASLRYTMWKIIASGDPEPLARAIDLLNQYVMAVVLIQDMIHHVVGP